MRKKIALALSGKRAVSCFHPMGVHSFEFWTFSKKHQLTLLDISQSGAKALAKALRVCFVPGSNFLVELGEEDPTICRRFKGVILSSVDS